MYICRDQGDMFEAISLTLHAVFSCCPIICPHDLPEVLCQEFPAFTTADISTSPAVICRDFDVHLQFEFRHGRPST